MTALAVVLIAAIVGAILYLFVCKDEKGGPRLKGGRSAYPDEVDLSHVPGSQYPDGRVGGYGSSCTTQYNSQYTEEVHHNNQHQGRSGVHDRRSAWGHQAVTVSNERSKVDQTSRSQTHDRCESHHSEHTRSSGGRRRRVRRTVEETYDRTSTRTRTTSTPDHSRISPTYTDTDSIKPIENPQVHTHTGPEISERQVQGGFQRTEKESEHMEKYIEE
ncbi:hypothetical protein Q1695_010201 [Nippostrongylus brasiliensis]|nr:hypothetical protein Q1695_010201 [Nippostrongylus brasiliensis]